MQLLYYRKLLASSYYTQTNKQLREAPHNLKGRCRGLRSDLTTPPQARSDYFLHHKCSQPLISYNKADNCSSPHFAYCTSLCLAPLTILTIAPALQDGLIELPQKQLRWQCAIQLHCYSYTTWGFRTSRFLSKRYAHEYQTDLCKFS